MLACHSGLSPEPLSVQRSCSPSANSSVGTLRSWDVSPVTLSCRSAGSPMFLRRRQSGCEGYPRSAGLYRRVRASSLPRHVLCPAQGYGPEHDAKRRHVGAVFERRD